MLFREVKLLRMAEFREIAEKFAKAETESNKKYYLDQLVDGAYNYRTDEVVKVYVNKAWSYKHSDGTTTEYPEKKTYYGKRIIPNTEGRVLSITKQYHYIGDGDGYYWHDAIVINDDGSPRCVKCGGYQGRDSRDGSIDLGSTVDLTDDLRAKYLAWKKIDDEYKQAVKEFDAKERLVSDMYNDPEQSKGQWAIVTKGRKIPKGTWGKIFWVRNDQYGWRIGMKQSETSDPTWVAFDNVEVCPYIELENGEFA